MSSITKDSATNQETEPVEVPQSAEQTPVQRDIDSGSDAGEKPVRERLEKTTIAKAQALVDHPTEGGDNDPMDVVAASAAVDELPAGDTRKRLTKKRSLEDPASGDLKDRPESPPTPSSGGHTRKRSRDVQPGENIKGQSLRSPEPTVVEENEDAESTTQLNGSRGFIPDSVDMETPPSSDGGHVDKPLQSPRRKRSRDEFDSELHRDQKIAATEESRARRSSDEERPSAHDLDNAVSGATEQSKANDETADSPETKGSPSLITKIPTTSGFSNTASMSPFGTLSGNKSPQKSPSDVQPQASASAFSSSGFAAMSGSASPFAAIGATSSIATKPSTSTSPSSQSPFGALAETPTTSTSGFGSSALSQSSSGKLGFGSFGGKVFGGSSFGGDFGGGQKRTNWAAPVGDTQLGNGVKEKPFGASEDSEDETSGSDDGSEAGGEDKREKENNEKEQAEEEGHKFKIQDTDTGEENEDTIFSVRGRLFQFHQDTKSWAERGNGAIKLNITRHEGEEEDSPSSIAEPRKAAARFLMRTAATHKVILNAPLFKEMKFGDALGKDPSGKVLYFSVPVDGKIVPHIIRMGKEDDVKSFHRAVKDLQDKM